jgi:hypothetical protein
MVWLSSLVPYEQASTVYGRISGRMIPVSSLWRETRRRGEKLKEAVEKQRTQVSPERVVLPGDDLDIRRGVSIDGGMVHIREEDWREFKVAAVFDLEWVEPIGLDVEAREELQVGEVGYQAALGTV